MSNQLDLSQTATPLQLYARQMELGVDPDKLRALLDLQEKWVADRARESFCRSMCAAQAEMPAVITKSHNPQTKSFYAALEDIQIACKPVWIKHGFSLSFSEGPTAPREGWKRIIAFVRHKDGHAEQHTLDLPNDGIGAKGNPIGAMNPVQGCISTMTYGERVLTANIFNVIIAGQDNDGQVNLETASPAELDELDDLIRIVYPDITADTITKSKMWQWIESKCGIVVPTPEQIPAIHMPAILDGMRRKATQVEKERSK